MNANLRDSGVDWLGLMPSHWNVMRLKHLAANKKFAIVDGPFGTQLKAEEYKSEGIPLIRITNLSYAGRLSTEGLVFISEEKANELSRSQVVSGDVVIGKTGATIGKSALVEGIDRAVIASSCLKISPNIDCMSSRFLSKVMISKGFLDHLVNVSGGSTRDTINIEPFGNIAIPVPPLDEQNAISAFIEIKEIEIESLIHDQEKLIALLKEKQQAVISHAVSKGLDPNVPMKDSGIEWLGEVPAHWDIGGLTRFIGPIVDYRGRTPTKVDSGTFLVTARNIRNGHIDYEASEEYVDADSAESLLARGRPEIGDLLFTMEAPLGQVALIDRIDIALAQRIVKFRGLPNIMLNEFLMYWLMSPICQARLETLATGSTALGIKASKLGMIECLVPPALEQEKIIAHIKRETDKLEMLTSEAKGAIDLLQERRAALISSAVTGKFDVRQYKPKEVA